MSKITMPKLANSKTTKPTRNKRKLPDNVVQCRYTVKAYPTELQREQIMKTIHGTRAFWNKSIEIVNKKYITHRMYLRTLIHPRHFVYQYNDKMTYKWSVLPYTVIGNKCLLRKRKVLYFRKFNAINMLPILKKQEDYSFLKDSDSKALQNVCNRLDDAYTRAYENRKKDSTLIKKPNPNKHFPNFKSKRATSQSYDTDGNVHTQKGYKSIQIPKLGKVRIRGLKQYLKENKLHSHGGVTVKVHNDGLIEISCILNIYLKDKVKHLLRKRPTINRKTYNKKMKKNPKESLMKPAQAAHLQGKALGIDVGITDIVVDNVNLYKTLRKLSKVYKDNVAKLEWNIRNTKKHLSELDYDTPHYNKVHKKLTKLSRKKKNMSVDYAHKVTYVYSFLSEIAVEDLGITDMMKSEVGTIEDPNYNSWRKRILNKLIQEQAWGRIFLFLDYKLKWYGGKLIKVDPYMTSQRCFSCGHISEHNRPNGNKKFKCVKCENQADADVNASWNIFERSGIELSKIAIRKLVFTEHNIHIKVRFNSEQRWK